MSYLSGLVGQLLAARGLTPRELARASAVPESRISKWLNDRQTYISLEDLGDLATVLCPSKVGRATLLRAQLLDYCQGPGSDLIEIRLRNGAGVAPALQMPLAPRLEGPLKTLRDNFSDPDLQRIVFGLAEMLERGANGENGKL